MFVDTSALLALLVADDAAHKAAKQAFSRLQAERATLVTSSYVLVESYALIGRRLGLEALRRFRDEMAPLVEVVWVNAMQHETALDDLLKRRKRALSLVDAVSFVLMRELKIDDAFVFDSHFTDEGFVQVA